MRRATLIQRSLSYYWRSNIAVILGVATAVAVLAGALLVGDSVRGSLRALFEERLGKTDEVITSSSFFREGLVDEIQADPRFGQSFAGACPIIVFSGVVSDQKTGRLVPGVQVYGVDDRFWKFHGLEEKVGTLADRDALLSPSLSRELGSQAGQTVLLRLEKPTAIPAGSLLGRKDDLGRTIRLVFRETLPASRLGEFSVRPGQGEVRAIFVSLLRLQKDLEQPGAANLILVKENEASGGGKAPSRPARMREILRDTSRLEDLGVKLRVLDGQRGIALESSRGVISDSLYSDAKTAAEQSGLRFEPILSYLANSIRVGEREVPYSIVTGLSQEAFDTLKKIQSAPGSSNEPVRAGGNVYPEGDSASAQQLPPMLLNDWAASNLGAHPDDTVTLEYYIWEDQGLLSTGSARFKLAGIVPMKDQAADRDLVPDYPGITTTQNIADWDPPFPVDLQRVRPLDEQYWHQYRTTPKAFVSLDTAQQLWQTRYGRFTSIRVRPGSEGDTEGYAEAFRQKLRAAMDPAANGLTVNAVRLDGIDSSRGATDFGEYFVYFSFFLVVGALLLASLFFKLGIEQRLREIGTLRAVGFPPAVVRNLFIREGAVLAVAGSILGMIGAVGYGALLMYGLRTWWVAAVGTTALTLHLSVGSLVAGAAAGTVAALLCIVWTLRRVTEASPSRLLTGSPDAATTDRVMKSEARSRWYARRASGKARGDGAGEPAPKQQAQAPFSSAAVDVVQGGIRNNRSPALGIAVGFALAGTVLVLLASLNLIGKTPGFFGAGTVLLLAALLAEHQWLSRKIKSAIEGRGWRAVSRLGFRNAAYRAGRSTLCIALIASAAFIIVAVESFKHSGKDSRLDRKSGTGGYPLLAESQLPLYHDPNTADGREALNISAQKGFNPDSVVFTSFRVRPGDDASCLNLYQPRDPKVLGAGEDFIRSGRFAFQESLAQTKEEKDNPWLLLNSPAVDGAIPAIADANSMTYVLHGKLGDEVVLNQTSGSSVKLRIVAALQDSLFQGELLISEANFLKLFPERGGYNFFLLDVTPDAAPAVSGVLDQQLSDFGFQAIATSERLAAFHRVENTYLATFEALGGLGLVLGTLGLAAVLLRNVLEQRRELGLLRAIGYDSRHFALMVITENAVLVIFGLVTGALCALVAIGPALVSRGAHLPAVSFGMMLFVLITGLFASVTATLAALRMPLLGSLRAE
jgi:ABC-type antimicrobial peptide transport system permease subunit